MDVRIYTFSGKNPGKLIQLRSKDGSNLVIVKGDPPPFCLKCNIPLDETERITIPLKNIIGWSKSGEMSTNATASKSFGAIALFVDPTAILLAPFGVNKTANDIFQILNWIDFLR